MKISNPTSNFMFLTNKNLKKEQTLYGNHSRDDNSFILIYFLKLCDYLTVNRSIIQVYLSCLVSCSKIYFFFVLNCVQTRAFQPRFGQSGRAAEPNRAH